MRRKIAKALLCIVLPASFIVTVVGEVLNFVSSHEGDTLKYAGWIGMGSALVLSFAFYALGGRQYRGAVVSEERVLGRIGISSGRIILADAQELDEYLVVYDVPSGEYQVTLKGRWRQEAYTGAVEVRLTKGQVPEGKTVDVGTFSCETYNVLIMDGQRFDEARQAGTLEAEVDHVLFAEEDVGWESSALKDGRGFCMGFVVQASGDSNKEPRAYVCEDIGGAFTLRVDLLGGNEA